MPAVKSSMFSAIDHDPKTNTLTATFTNGSKHTYEGVDSKKFDDLMKSGSVGKHFNTHIRPNHKATKLG